MCNVAVPREGNLSEYFLYSSILSCEDVAKSDAETDKSVSVLRHDAYTSACFIGTSHSNVIYNN